MLKTNISNEYRQGLKKKIVLTAERLFRAHGIRAVKMDDVAHALSISKRTLYEIYSNKEDVLLAVCKKHDEELSARFASFGLEKHNVIEIIMEVFHLQIEEMQVVNPVFFEDLAMYPPIKAYMESKRAEREEYSSEFIRRGIEQGFFRGDINYDIIRTMMEATSQFAVANKLYRKYPFADLFRNTVFVFMRGFSTQKGIDAIDEALANFKAV